MTRKETIQVLGILKTAYPYFYKNLSIEDNYDETMRVIDLWHEMLKDEDSDTVKLALKSLIASCADYPPNIGHLMKKIDEFKESLVGYESDESLWLKLKSAARNGIYDSIKEFEKLPECIKNYLGNHAALIEFGNMQESAFDTYEKNRFMKNIGSYKASAYHKEYRALIEAKKSALALKEGESEDF